MSIEFLIVRAAVWSGSGTFLAILANAAIGDHDSLLPASFLGATIGSAIGWVIVVRQGYQPSRARD